MQGALSGGLSSGIGSGIDGLKGNSTHQILGGGLGGGFGAVITGGNFFKGFGQGIAVGAFNHAFHNLSFNPPKKGDLKLSHKSWGMVLEYDGFEWVPTGDWVMASGQIQVAAAPWEYVMGGNILKNGIVNFKAIINKNNWVRIGEGKHEGKRFFRIAFGARGHHIKEVPKWLQPLNKMLSKINGNGHIDLWKLPN